MWNHQPSRICNLKASNGSFSTYWYCQQADTRQEQMQYSGWHISQIIPQNINYMEFLVFLVKIQLTVTGFTLSSVLKRQSQESRETNAARACREQNTREKRAHIWNSREFQISFEGLSLVGLSQVFRWVLVNTCVGGKWEKKHLKRIRGSIAEDS